MTTPKDAGTKSKSSSKKKLYPNPTGSGTWASTVKPKKPKPSSYGNFGRPITQPQKVAPSTTLKPKPKPTKAGVKTWTDFFQGAIGKKAPSKDRSTSGNTVQISRPGTNPLHKSSSYRSPSSVGSSRGSANRALVGNSRGGGSKGRGGKGHGGGGGGGPRRANNKSLMEQARKYINADTRAAIDILRNEKGARKNDFKWARSEANAQYDRAQGDLTHIFGEANEQNKLQTQAILDRILGTQNSTNQIFNNLGGQIQGNTSANTQALVDELSRLGVQGGANLAPIQADSAWAGNMANQGRANTLANLDAMSQSAGDIGSLLSQMSNSSLASNLGQQANLRSGSIADARNMFLQQKDDIRDSMRQERLQKGTRTMDLYRELEDQAYNRWFQEREANRANRLGWSNFNQGVSMDNAGLMMQKAQMLQEQRAAAAERRAQENQLRALNGGGNNNRFNPMAEAAKRAFPGLFG